MPDPSIIAIASGVEPSEGRKAIPMDIAIPASGIVIDLVPQNLRLQFKNPQTLYVDNADNDFQIVITNNITAQRFVIAAKSQGYYQLIIPSPARIKFECANAPATIKVQILNFYVQPVTWSVETGGSAMGTVTSVGLVAPNEFSVSGSPVTTAGNLEFQWDVQASNLILAGPFSGPSATPSFRPLVLADLPAGIGTVTSVGLTVPNIFNVTGSPVVGAGVLAVSLANQGANTIWAGPAAGAAAAPSFRSLVSADLPPGIIPVLTGWTPVDTSGAGLSLTINYAQWVQLGSLVILLFNITYPVTANGANQALGGLPHNPTANLAGSISAVGMGAPKPLANFVLTSGNINIYDASTETRVTNAQMSGVTFSGSIIYPM